MLQRDEHGAPSGLLSSGDDITDLRQLERLSTRRQRLEAIGTLAGGIAHDLNNALSPAVMGMGILREADGERRVLDVPVVVQEVERLIRNTFPKNISLSVQLPNDTPHLIGDATQIHQVLVNLAVNARDAMANGGLLSITGQVVDITADEASRVSVAAARPGRFLRLAVRDTGEGIPDELLDRVFDPFYTTKPPERGTGLGLSTVLGIVKGHEGFVQVESRLGICTTFYVYLPLPAVAPSGEAVAEPAAETVATGLVLFVDDEPFIRSVVTMLAHRIGYGATTAASADEALALLHRSAHNIVTVVTDLHMPGRDGLALTREIRRRWPEMPVVIVSGLMTDELWRQVHELPRVSVLPKPFSETQLRQILEQGRRQSVGEAD